VALGRHAGVAEINGLKVTGPLAWVLWRTFYLSRLPGLERKLRVLLDWNLDLLFRRDIVQLSVERTERLTTAHYQRGEDIGRQGTPADRCYVLLKGAVQVLRRRDGQEEEEELNRLGPGASFGEVGLLKRQCRNATVRALEPVDVLSLEQADFDLLIGH